MKIILTEDQLKKLTNKEKLEQKKQFIKNELMNRREVWFNLGDDVDLRVWGDNDSNGGKFKPIDTIFSRIERQNEFSVPIERWNEGFPPNTTIDNLLRLGGFKIPIDKIDEYIDYIKKLRIGKPKYW